MEQETIIAVSVLGAVSGLLLLLVVVLFVQVASLRRRINELHHNGSMRVQKLTLENDKNHAFHNPAISPDEELARRGYSMYAAGATAAPGADQLHKEGDVESARGTERQTGGEFVEELSCELDHREHRRLEEQRNQDRQLRLQEEQQQHDRQIRRHEEQQQQDRLQRRYEEQQQQDRLQRRYEEQQQQDRLQRRQEEQQQQGRQKQQQMQPPPFLLQSIEENKRRSRSLANPVTNGCRQSDTNPNFIY